MDVFEPKSWEGGRPARQLVARWRGQDAHAPDAPRSKRQRGQCRWLLPLIGAILVLAGAARADEKHFCWKVTSGKAVVYLFGSIHMGKADLYPLPRPIEDSFAKADRLVEEIDPNDKEDQARVTRYIALQGVYGNGDSVENHIGEATRIRLADYAKKHQMGSMYRQAKPWLVGLLIAQSEAKRLGFDTEIGLDKHFLEEAAKLKKPIEGLETGEFQIKLLSGFSDELQDQSLLATLLDAEKAQEMLERTMQAWKAGDPAALEDVVNYEVKRYPFLQTIVDKLLNERNDDMTKKIEGFLKTDSSYFVVVGAGHLVGKRGIVEQLRGKNYAIEQM